jgi:hypothetical protein
VLVCTAPRHLRAGAWHLSNMKAGKRSRKDSGDKAHLTVSPSAFTGDPPHSTAILYKMALSSVSSLRLLGFGSCPSTSITKTLLSVGTRSPDRIIRTRKCYAPLSEPFFRMESFMLLTYYLSEQTAEFFFRFWSYHDKGKVVHVVYLIKALHQEDVCGSGCIGPRILDLDASWKRMGSSRPCRFTPVERVPGTHRRRPGGLQSRSGRCGEEKNLAPTRTRTPAPRSYSP